VLFDATGPNVASYNVATKCCSWPRWGRWGWTRQKCEEM